MTRKINFFHFILILSTAIMICFISFGTAVLAGNSQIIINENLKPGMTLESAIKLLGPPESINVSNTGTVIMPYDSLGLSIEALSGGTVVEGVHLQSTFKGKFSSGFGIGADFREILSAYNQPDIMTKAIIEYSDRSTIFQISKGKLIGADLYSGGSTLYHQTSSKEAGTYEAKNVEKYKNKDAGKNEDHEAGKNEDEETEEYHEFDVFDLYGFNIKFNRNKIIITEIRPGSVAENGGLKAGEPIRKAFYKGSGKRNIYTVSGLKGILKRAVSKHKKFVYILQNERHYYKVEVPKGN